ncbi:MAG: translation initiation factor IF-3 [Alphaproteobacteria bacterium]|nr:translation initiation factor IF-3 [Alphaproteobacteria bacterium]
MPRFDNKAPPPKDDGPRVNYQIDARTVRLIANNGDNMGVVDRDTAIRKAEEAGFDLVEISPGAAPPVCKILDLGKYKYEIQKKENEAKKKQKVIEVKELKVRPTIGAHDYDVKMRAMKRFIEEGDKVKITLRFRGREMMHQELGSALLERIRNDNAETTKVEQEPRMEGRQVVMVFAPK